MTEDQSEFFAILAAAEDKTLYVSDLGTWVSLPDQDGEDGLGFANATEGGLEARQSCEVTEQRRVLRTHDYWGPWHAVSGCGFSAGVEVSGTETLSVSWGGG